MHNLDKRLGTAAFLTALLTLASTLLHTDRAAPRARADLRHLLASDVVFVGKILDVGPKPELATGIAGIARQVVTYEVVQLVRGLAPRKEPRQLAVRHAIINGPTADVKRNRLSTKVFARGRVVLVGCVLQRVVEPDASRPFPAYSLIDDSERTAVVEAGRVHLHDGNLVELAAVRRELHQVLPHRSPRTRERGKDK